MIIYASGGLKRFYTVSMKINVLQETYLNKCKHTIYLELLQFFKIKMIKSFNFQSEGFKFFVFLNEFQLKKHIVQTLQEEESAIRLIFASVALGMGADLRHVKRVIHAGPPTSLESKFYFKQASCTDTILVKRWIFRSP